MFTYTNRTGLSLFAGLVVFGLAAPAVVAQRPANAGRSLPGIQPFFRVAPGLNIQQAAFNTTAMGMAFQNFPAHALPFAPGYALGFGGARGQFPVTPGLSPGTSFFYNSPAALAASPYGFSNPYTASLSSTAGFSGNPYGSYGSGGLGGDQGGYYPPYYPPYYSPFNGYLSGAADVIKGQGQYMVSTQQSNLLKQSVAREKIENRRRAFEEWLYEREKTPTAEDERQRVQEMELRRARNDPPATEIYSGKALNELLNHVRKVQAANVQPAQFPLDKDTIDRINVRPAGGIANAGLLKNDGKLNWPLALDSDDFRNDRELIDSVLPDAVRQAGGPAARVGPGTLTDLTNAVDHMQKVLRSRIKDIPPSQHMEARRFLNNLDDAVKALRQPDAGKYVNGTYAAKGQSVPDLVKNMSGLEFAPAIPGDEAAYKALHQALVGYDMATQSQVAAEKHE